MNVLGLCAGGGGLERGLRLAVPSARTVCVVEREAFCIANMVAAMEQGAMDKAPIWTDVRTFDGKPWRGKVDIVTAGYPCQPFSVAGKQRGTDDPRHIWQYIARIIGEVNPTFVFCENVSGHLHIGFQEVCRDMEYMGYRVASVVSSAGAVGAPHERERLYWLATNTDSERLSQREERNSEQNTRRAPQRDDSERRESWCWWDAPSIVCGMDDGMGCRVDRIRMLGNGVVPQQAASSFRELIFSLFS